MPSENVKRYCGQVQAWIDKGMPTRQPFTHDHALCTNASWAKGCGAPADLRAELAEAFAEDGLDRELPFNPSLGLEVLFSKVYENPQRLEWIKNHAQNPN